MKNSNSCKTFKFILFHLFFTLFIVITGQVLCSLALNHVIPNPDTFRLVVVPVNVIWTLWITMDLYAWFKTLQDF